MSKTGHHRTMVRRVLFLSASISLVIEGQASAYLDPGTISFFFQAVIAGLLGGLLVLKRYWQQIKTGLSRLFSPKTRDDGD